MKGILTILISMIFSSTAMAGMAYTYISSSGEKIVVTKAFSEQEMRDQKLLLQEVSYTPPVSTVPPAAAAPRREQVSGPAISKEPSMPKVGEKSYDANGNVTGVILKIGPAPERSTLIHVTSSTSSANSVETSSSTAPVSPAEMTCHEMLQAYQSLPNGSREWKLGAEQYRRMCPH